jgi:hypothetical protein
VSGRLNYWIKNRGHPAMERAMDPSASFPLSVTAEIEQPGRKDGS